MVADQIIIAPLITEKSQELEAIHERIEEKRKNSRRASNGKKITKYSFKVHVDANKIQVKEAIEKIFNVKPASVNMQVYRGKIKKFRYVAAPKAHWKKAIVTFHDGTTLDIVKV
ncbi:50S ribosomal protein L23 [Leptospira sp. GIMC2001]|uniref:50S ribosomal protein L23 n=1 Tax=Leptospira sp. GIMC2001 TaxID=1513297 RepID=UPI00234BDF4E|nr:50S ribosomal protein L23 [Leptospira sp. GIMC2001]WCL51082.1 50S ribosomal protein L23 [Leptospira sp. GIMC2001]